jgi:hypothetical protein
MEKKEIQEWRDRLIKMFGIYHSDGQEYITCPLCGINLDELAKHMIEELDKAREEGIEEVYKKFCEWEMPRDLSKEQKEMFDDLLSEINKLKQ